MIAIKWTHIHLQFGKSKKGWNCSLFGSWNWRRCMSVSPKRGGATVAVSVRGPSTHIVQVKGKQTFCQTFGLLLAASLSCFFLLRLFFGIESTCNTCYGPLLLTYYPSPLPYTKFSFFILIYHMVMNKKKRYIILVVNYWQVNVIGVWYSFSFLCFVITNKVNKLWR